MAESWLRLEWRLISHMGRIRRAGFTGTALVRPACMAYDEESCL
jgi:hypothetical protein